MISDTLDLIKTGNASWMAKALCARHDPEVWFSHPGEEGETERAAMAVRICRSCSVRVECLVWAFREQDQWAILGGKTPRERKEILGGRTPRLMFLRRQVLGLFERE